MKILGVHCGHDSTVGLVINGKIVANVAEERFTRVKHYSGLPFNSVKYCLEEANLKMEDIDVIAIPFKKGAYLLDFLFDFNNAQTGGKSSIKKRLWLLIKNIERGGRLELPTYKKRFKVGEGTRVMCVEHHLAHAASAYYTSGLKKNEKALIVTCDGVGDGISTAVWRGYNGKIKPLVKYGPSGSLGLFYSNVTEALGWVHGDGEGKTMGLAPYGNPKKAENCLEGYYPVFKDGKLKKGHDFGRVGFWNEKGAIEPHFEDATKIKRLIPKYGAENIAAEAQRILEEQMFELIFPWLKKEKTDILLCSGGLFLNVKLNQRIWYSNRISKHWPYPEPVDSGLSAGAALYAYHSLNSDSPIWKLENLYLGPRFMDSEIESYLKLRKLSYKKVENISEKAANLLAEGKIIAWFQGRMESGPRALGNRSILMSANKAKNKDIINRNVKFREGFRPFCPSVLYECKDQYLVNAREEPFMITSFDAVPSKKSKIPAVVHKDGTLRAQTLRREVNPKFYDLIKKFGDITGEYVILNTSFNIKGEPIICKPSEAVRCFYDNGIDALVMGNFLIEK